MNEGTPAYQCTAYRRQLPLWGYLDDLFAGSEAWLGRDEAGQIHVTYKAQSYLPREAAEESGDYLNRLACSPFDDRFAQSLRKFVALVLANGIEQIDIPPIIQPHFDNLDYQGGSLQQIVGELAIKALRHGHTFLLIDYPLADPSIRSQADYERSGRRPYWVSYAATQVIHWVTEVIRGRTELKLVTLRESAIGAVGEFSEREVTRYRVLRPGSWELWEEVEEQGRCFYQQIDGGPTSLSFIPLVCLYGGLREGFFRSRPPLKALADLNLTHYQVKSDHLRKLHLCCLPVPELRDSMRPDGEALTIGPNAFIHIRDPQGSFNWKEPLATSIEQSRKEVSDLEESMDVISAAYLNQPGDRQTATTTAIQAVELESNLQTFADQFCEGLNEALRYHAAYLGISDGGKLKLSGDIIRDKGRDSQMLLAYSAMGERRQLDNRSLLQLLKDQEFLPEEFDIDSQPSQLATDGVLLGQLLNLPQLDVLDKRQFLQLLKDHSYLPGTFDIESAIASTGEEIRIAQVGYLKSQPVPGDVFIPPA